MVQKINARELFESQTTEYCEKHRDCLIRSGIITHDIMQRIILVNEILCNRKIIDKNKQGES